MIEVGKEPPPMRSAHEQSHKARKQKPAKGESKGRFAVLNAFVDYTLATLDHPCRAVWLVLYRDTKPNGLARTAQMDIARRIGMSGKTVQRAVSKLEKLGLLTVKYRGGLGGRMSVYRVRAIPSKGT